MFSFYKLNIVVTISRSLSLLEFVWC